jgi:hypothetical protein
MPVAACMRLSRRTLARSACPTTAPERSTSATTSDFTAFAAMLVILSGRPA